MVKDKPVPRSIDEMLDDAWNKDYDRNRFKQELNQLIEWIISDYEIPENTIGFGKPRNHLRNEQCNRLSQAMKGKK